MANSKELIALEKEFWTGSSDDYRRHLDDHCMIAFAEMAGVMTREAIADTVKDPASRWHDLKIVEKGFLEPEPGIALLTYEASAMRSDDKPYHALVSSLYVQRDGEWKMAFHQQTPLVDEKKAAKDKAA